MKSLDEWRLIEPRRTPRQVVPVLKWAAAAAVILIIGFALGRLATPSVDAQSLRASLERQLDRKLQSMQMEFARQLQDAENETIHRAMAVSSENAIHETQRILTDFVNASSDERAQDNEAIRSALARLNSQHQADYASLRSELETVAVLTQASLQNLVSYSQAADMPQSDY